ncbi:unnamed protein product [Eruca vesicaria subsp. sativa]|uniref:RING-CH-type domain-containing protein n=1 Tax=Eruca vesicaria subsp. sativa TaxID=29727 RepID=A0ABC8L422_ERUVS|nr:unnamed protein product [Eruca vesicaria subsp. sativa]
MMMMDDDHKTPHDISPAIMDTEITREVSPSQHERWRCLVLDIELRAQEDARGSFTPPSVVSQRFNFSPMASPRIGPSSSSRRTNLKNVFTFRNRNNNNADIEEGAGLVSNIPRTWSLTNLLTLLKSNNTESLPLTPLVHSNPESMHGGRSYTLDGQEHTLPIRRSRSVPTLIDKDGNVKQPLGLLRVIPTPFQRLDSESKLNCDGGEDVPEEEAVCRICMVELGEDSEAFKMECMCKGELALAHKACTIKWFTIKGNITCDVCKQVVKNLPVTLLRVEDSQDRSRAAERTEMSRLNEWQDVPVLVIVSMLAYFCFLEQLLVMEMKSSAVAVALPFSCIIGLLASVISTTMVKRNYVWIFATIQFGLVVLFGHVFLPLVKQPVVCIVLATMIGFGLTMSSTTAINEFFKWRRSYTHHQAAEPASTQVVPPPSQAAVE